METVKAAGVKKTPLMLTSQYSRAVAAPVNVSINFLRNLTRESFSRSFIPVGYLLEGKFTSLFKNRFAPEGVDTLGFRAETEFSKIIVVADGDLAINMVNPRTGQPMPLGYDRSANRNYANEELLMNMLAWLTDENGLINARNKEIKIRPLDKEKIASEKTKWQVINLLLPLMALIFFGVVRSYLRKRRYASF
jgi:ABC-2 type transport system permease protein